QRQPRRPLARGLGLDLRGTVHEEVAADDRQAHDAVLLRIADHGLGLLAAHHALGVVEDAPAHHDDAAGALAQVLLRAVGDRALADPGAGVLIHDVRSDPAVGERVLNGARPVRDALLPIRLGLLASAV